MHRETNFQSSYWKVNSLEFKSSSTNESPTMSPKNTAMSREADTLAVSSNSANENLRIYQFSNDSLIHLASITLSDIHSLKFLKPVSEPPYDFKFLLSGHSNGIMHLSAIPLTEGSIFKNAEIIKRFNHKKALNAIHDTRKSYILNNGLPSTTITAIDLSSSSWTSSPLNSSVVVYDHHLFYWDTTNSAKPISIFQKPGISNVATNKQIDSLTAIVGDFGLSLLDLRAKNSNISSSTKFNPLGYSSAHWCNSNENLLATVTSDPNTVQLWDIRNLRPITTLTEFSGKINDIKWSDQTLWVAQSSGRLSKRDLTDNNPPVALDFKISNSSIKSLELNNDGTNMDEVICIDSMNISTHKTYKKKVSTEQLLKLSSPSTFKANSAISDTPKSEFSNIFDFKSNDRRDSDETLIVSSKSGDYLIDFQKEVSQMIQQMDTITINNIVYL